MLIQTYKKIQANEADRVLIWSHWKKHHPENDINPHSKFKDLKEEIERISSIKISTIQMVTNVLNPKKKTTENIRNITR